MNNEIILTQEKRKIYYNKVYTIFEILKCMQKREVIFMDNDFSGYCIRGLNIKSFDYMVNLFFKEFRFQEKNYNIYISCAKYKNIPNFTLDLKERSKFTLEWFNNDALYNITDYDLLLDFDCKIPKERKIYLQQLYLFLQTLNNSKICYYIIFSGNNHQIVIPSNIYGFKNGLPEDKNFVLPLQIAKAIKNRFQLNYLDLKGIGVFNKIMKCPYSLVNDKVVLPLENTVDIMKVFKIEDVLNNTIIKNRGLMWKNCFDNETNIKHWKRFEIDYLI